MCQPDQVAKIFVKDTVVRGSDPSPDLPKTFVKGITYFPFLFMGWGFLVLNLSLVPLLPQQGNFNSSVGPDGYMLSALTCGMSPVTSITEGLQQVQPTRHQGVNVCGRQCGEWAISTSMGFHYF